MIKTIAIASILMISSFAVAGQAPKTAMEKAVEIYNSVSSRDEALAILRSQASPADVAYLDMLRNRIRSQTLPRARAQGNNFYLDGLDKPIVAEDLAKGVFSYNGRKFALDFAKEFRVNMQVLEENLRPQEYAWVNWILPRAHANFDLSTLVAGAGVGLGLGWATANCEEADSEDTGMFSCQNKKTLGVALAAGSGMFALMKYKNDKDEREEERKWWRKRQMAGVYGPGQGPIVYPLPAVYRAPASPYPTSGAAVTAPFAVQTVTQGAGASR